MSSMFQNKKTTNTSITKPASFGNKSKGLVLNNNRSKSIFQKKQTNGCGVYQLNGKEDPSLRSQRDPQTRALAFKQTRAARELLHRPDKTVKGELSHAAQKLMSIHTGLPSDELRSALNARLLGKEGIMKGQKNAHVYDALSRVKSDHHSTTSADRAAVIELMGGIGALFADTGATTGMESRSKKQADDLRSHLYKAIPNIDPEKIKAIKELGDSSVVGPLKKQERDRPDKTLVPRKGMHNLGTLADLEAEIPSHTVLPLISWQKATIDSKKVERTSEPLSGHMSGSPSEALAIWDALSNDPSPYTASADDTRRKMAQTKDFSQTSSFHGSESALKKSARLAASTAYLVSTGFHSSVEVLESAMKYTGQDPRHAMFESHNHDASDFFGHGAATSLIRELHESHTVPIKKTSIPTRSKAPNRFSSAGTMARDGIFPTVPEKKGQPQRGTQKKHYGKIKEQRKPWQ